MIDRVKLFLISLLLLASVFTVVANNNAEASASDENAIEFWAYQPENEKPFRAAIANFEAETGYKVNITFVPKDSYNTKVNAAIVGGMSPDVAYLDQPLVPRFAADGVLLNLEAHANGENGIDKTKYYQGALGTNIVGGELYGLPLNQTCVALYYNKDLVPEPPVTWDDWLSMASDVYIPGEVAAFEVPNGDGWGAWLYPAFVASAGGSMVNADETIVTIDEQPAVDAIELWTELRKFSDYEVTDSTNAFNLGLIATKVSGPWELGNLRNNFPDLDFGVTLMPKKTANDIHASNIGGENIVVYNTVKNPEAAWALIKFLTYTPEYSLLMAESTGNFPGLLEAGMDAKFQNDEHLAVFLKQMETAQARPRIPSWLKINDEVVAKALSQVILEELTAQEALSLGAQKANMIMERDK